MTIMTNILHTPRGLPARSGTIALPAGAPRPGTGLSLAEIRQIVLDILG